MRDQSSMLPIEELDSADPSISSWYGGDASDRQANKRFRRKSARSAGSAEIVQLSANSLMNDRVPTNMPVATVGSARSKYNRLVSNHSPIPIRTEWQALRQITPGVRRHFLSGAALVDFFRSDPAARAFDLLRTSLLQTLRANGWSRIAIAAPTQGCGSTFTAVNLAQSLARIPGSRTVLMDINNRTPGVAGMLDIDVADVGDMRGFLDGTVPAERHLVRASQTLALGLTSGLPWNAAEILHDPRCGRALNRMTESLQPDVVLYDLPPVLAYDDLTAFLPQVDGVLLVADGTQTLAGQITACEKILEGHTQVLSVVLNRARNAETERDDR
jgi:protein-tyrosine kinase